MVVEVGDKVRSLVTEMDVVAGNEYRVIDAYGATVHVTDAVGDPYRLEAGEWEPLTADEVTDNDKPPFKVGDRVRLIKDGQSTTGAVGKLATIESWAEKLIDNGQYLLNIDGPVDYQTRAVTPNYTRATPDCFELVLQIEAGKYYRTRDGRKVGPMERVSHNGQFRDTSEAVTGYGWYSNGTYIEGVQGNIDLIAEWVDDPVTENTNHNTTPVTEQREAEPRRFKVGDKVRALIDYCWVKSGTEYIVNSLDSDGDVWLKNVDGKDAYMTDSELELITPVEEKHTPATQSGEVTLKISLDATEVTEAIKSTLVRTKRGYGFEIARHGDYIWVDTGLNAPITFKATNVQAAT
ncbi:MAG TPA: hypothetical protein VG519_13195 [Pseudochrobactrum sp.]|nr:hypothetical protein [Pseudochrobactrum sp.]